MARNTAEMPDEHEEMMMMMMMTMTTRNLWSARYTLTGICKHHAIAFPDCYTQARRPTPETVK